MAIKLSEACRNAMLDGITTTVGGSALLRIYDNTTSVPANVAASNSTNVLLAELTCNATFAPSASGGVLTLNSISNDTAANATGTAAYFRIYKSDGTTAVIQGTVTATGGGGDLTVATVSFVQNAVVSVSSFTLTAGGA